MAKRRGDTRRDILNTAEQLLQLRGYHGFSYHHIAAELGMRNAAVHYHFPGKSDLGAAVIQRFREGFRWWRQQLDPRGLTGAQQLERFLALDGRYAEQRKVCPLGVVGVEFEGLPPQMCREADQLLDDVLGYIRAALDAGLADGSLSFRGDTHTVALQVVAATQGALQLHRVRGRGYAEVSASLREQLGMREVPAPARAVG